jgi:hypothetical protein
MNNKTTFLKKNITKQSEINNKYVSNLLNEWINNDLIELVYEKNIQKIFNKIKKTCYTKIINDLYSINPRMTGNFIDILMKRLISEINQELFYCNKAQFRLIHPNNKSNLTHILTSLKHDNTYIFDIYNSWNIYKDSCLDSNIISVLHKGNIITIIDKKDEWINIKFDHIIGWIRIKSCRFLNKMDKDYHKCNFQCKFLLKQHELLCKNGNKIGYILPLCRYDSYNKTMDTINYKTSDIISEIFITSLCQYNRIYNSTDIDNYLKYLNNDVVNNDKDLNDNFIIPLYSICLTLLHEKSNILVNENISFNYESEYVGAECDLILDNTIIEIKCSKTFQKYIINPNSQLPNNNVLDFHKKIINNKILSQLLGYSAMLLLNPKYNIKVNTICIVNILEGNITIYNIHKLQESQFKTFLNKLIIE